MVALSQDLADTLSGATSDVDASELPTPSELRTEGERGAAHPDGLGAKLG
jgi:hypothetical protein